LRVDQAASHLGARTGHPTHQLAKSSTSTAESLGWLEFIKRAKLLSSPELPRLLQEALELRNIFGASGGTARDRQRTDFKR